MKIQQATILMLMLLVLMTGCTTTRVIEKPPPHVRMTDQGQIYVGGTYTGLSNLAAQLKANRVPRQTQITVEIPQNTSPNALSAIGRELASNGYVRFIFSKPRVATAKTEDTPTIDRPEPDRRLLPSSR